MILTAGMAHPRKLIRQAVVTLLTSETAADTRVSPTRVEPHRKSALPAISVYTLHESVERASSGPRELTRAVKVEVAGWVKHSEANPVDDAMDDLAEEIESAMDADPYLGGVASDSVLEDTEMQVLEGSDADPLVGVVTLTYLVTYFTSPAPPAELDDFLTVTQSTVIVGGVEDDTVPVNDEFIVQEIP